MTTQKEWIAQLGLLPHSEGGYYKEMFHSEEQLQTLEGNQRYYYTSIYFLLTTESPSHFHRLKADELWYFHTGSSLSIHLLHPDGQYEQLRLGTNLAAGEVLQARVPKGVIFGSSVEEGEFSLVSCMVSPGFDYHDFELFTKQELHALYPNEATIIEALAYEQLPE